MRAQFTAQSRGAGIPRTCPECGATFITFRSEVLRGGARFCSRVCYHEHRLGKGKPLEERFWSKVRITAGCWLWTAGVDTHGYGQIGGAGVRTRLAHRVAWELVKGPIPAGANLLHRCDTPRCVRPDHLFLGSQADNMADAASKGRTTQGERSHTAKLTAADVLEIRRRHAAGKETGSALARSFGIAQCTVSQIVHRATWKHLPVTD